MFIFLLYFFKNLLIISILRHWTSIQLILLWHFFPNHIEIFSERFLSNARHNSFHILRITRLIFKIRLVKIWRRTTATLAHDFIALFNSIFSHYSSGLTLLPQAIRIVFAWNRVFLGSHQRRNLTVHLLNSLNRGFFALPDGFRGDLILRF